MADKMCEPTPKCLHTTRMGSFVAFSADSLRTTTTIELEKKVAEDYAKFLGTFSVILKLLGAFSVIVKLHVIFGNFRFKL